GTKHHSIWRSRRRVARRRDRLKSALPRSARRRDSATPPSLGSVRCQNWLSDDPSRDATKARSGVYIAVDPAEYRTEKAGGAGCNLGELCGNALLAMRTV